ncbi:hypothetical protein BgiBS90_005405, partial [Biomphalaria glabrata]
CLFTVSVLSCVCSPESNNKVDARSTHSTTLGGDITWLTGSVPSASGAGHPSPSLRCLSTPPQRPLYSSPRPFSLGFRGLIHKMLSINLKVLTDPGFSQLAERERGERERREKEERERGKRKRRERERREKEERERGERERREKEERERGERERGERERGEKEDNE